MTSSPPPSPLPTAPPRCRGVAGRARALLVRCVWLVLLGCGAPTPPQRVAAANPHPAARALLIRGARVFDGRQVPSSTCPQMLLPACSAWSASRPVAFVSSPPSGPGDCALVLHTSGTTSRPKRVALTHRNIDVAAGATAAVLELTADDRSLNILPLFHVHGLIGAVLAPLVAGGSVVCSPGFAAAEFFDWVAATQPTWFTAVPTIHQAILARARLDAAAAGAPPGTSRHRLRFVRSASSALPVSVLHELERVFAAPLIETYGMTEASPIIACNPLPPRQRKPGSVGLPVAAEVARAGRGSRA